MEKPFTISVVVPVYREETNIVPFLQRTENVLQEIPCDYEILFCLDPSPDSTEQVILREIQRNGKIRLVRFSRRFGQPAATLAGIHLCRGDVCVVIDVDLQDPPELIIPMLAKWREGYRVVCAKRKTRKGETFLKKVVTRFGYQFINRISDVAIPENTGDFRLMDRRVVDELKKMHESHGFLRGMVAFVGFRQTFIEYDRDERAAGISNYNRHLGSLRIALNGIVGFSIRPLQIASVLGGLIAVGAFLLGFWILVEKLVLHADLTPGLTWTIVLITFLSGVQLLSLGIMGEYVGRIYEEVKRRPVYIVERKENISDE
ncbi:MAG TPA: glycosyltransferase family 2 protein [Methanoregulaceae archaeon]|nr:glycosyltransferase family 2 protein [Methanoregulaceae archaeon]HRY76340.1 glycosyltransferase family 2 protein [Methanoregulaceae archaeon]